MIESFAGTGNPFAMGELAPGENVEFREAFMEDIPVPDGWADVVISNGVLNLTPDKQATVVAAGFTEVEITWRAEVFEGAPQASSASKFGTVGINFRARKP